MRYLLLYTPLYMTLYNSIWHYLLCMTNSLVVQLHSSDFIEDGCACVVLRFHLKVLLLQHFPKFRKSRIFAIFGLCSMPRACANFGRSAWVSDWYLKEVLRLTLTPASNVVQWISCFFFRCRYFWYESVRDIKFIFFYFRSVVIFSLRSFFGLFHLT